MSDPSDTLLDSSMDKKPSIKDINGRPQFDPELTAALNKIPEGTTKTVERISALVGAEYAHDSRNSPHNSVTATGDSTGRMLFLPAGLEIINLSLIEASVIALQELYSSSLEPLISGWFVDKRRFKECYRKHVTEPCEELLKVYRAFSENIENYWKKSTEIPYLRREGRLRIWAQDCVFLVDSLTKDAILEEFTGLIGAGKKQLKEDGRGALRHYYSSIRQ